MSKESVQIQEIVDGCKRNDRKAQEELYRNYFRSLMSICVRYTKNEQDAMEVLNTGFYKVFKSIGSYDAAKASLYTWMRTIVINSCLAFIKSNASQQGWKELDSIEAIDISQDLFARLSAGDILKLVRKLPASTQAVFNLYVMEGYQHTEIAAMMGISTGTSKWHLSEARRLLKDLLHKTQQL